MGARPWSLGLIGVIAATGCYGGGGDSSTPQSQQERACFGEPERTLGELCAESSRLYDCEAYATHSDAVAAAARSCDDPIGEWNFAFGSCELLMVRAVYALTAGVVYYYDPVSEELVGLETFDDQVFMCPPGSEHETAQGGRRAGRTLSAPCESLCDPCGSHDRPPC